LREEYPIKHVLVFNFDFEKSSNLDEVARRLGESGFYLVRARKDVLAATSKVKPYIVLFLFVQRTPEGGELFLIQTHDGWFSYDELIGHIPILEASAGVKIRPSIFNGVPKNSRNFWGDVNEPEDVKVASQKRRATA